MFHNYSDSSHKTKDMLIYGIIKIKYFAHKNFVPHKNYSDLFIRRLIFHMDQNSNIILEDNNYGVKTLIVQIQTIC